MSDGKDLVQRISEAGARMDPGLSDRDVDRLVAGAVRRRRRQKIRRTFWAGGTAFAAGIGLLVVLHRPHPANAPMPLATSSESPAATAMRTLRLSDGSTATALDSATEMAIVEDGNEHATLALTRGRGRFDVVPRRGRTFVVSAGNVTVTVLGTVFTVERVADRVGVAVETGTVRIEWSGGAAILQEGGSAWYPPLPVADLNAAAVASPRASVARPAHSQAPVRNQAQPPALAAPGKLENAEDLLAAADNARLSGQPAEGAELLRKLLRDHRNDPRAPLAAFTLGRMLLIELHQPLEAAGVFADARRLSPLGPLAEDALARESEALRAAGKDSLAKSRAQDYLRVYPEGRRAPAMRMILGK